MSEDGKKTEENRIKDEKGLFVEGNPGGPGRPKGSYSIVEMIKRKLQEHPEGKDKTYGEYFVEKIMKKIAVDEDVSMMKDIINRVDGMPKEHIQADITMQKPIYGGTSISKHISNEEDIQSNEKN